MKKILLIVDPQNDFIEGTLPVEGAIEAMKSLSEWINKNASNIDAIYVTTDQHPMNHSSFLENGGLWPTHCVKYSDGAAIFPAVFDSILKYSRLQKSVYIIEKGTQANLEEYSAFHTTVPAAFEEANSIVICGIAGDVCVLNSLKDLFEKGFREKISVLHECTASLDGGEKLNAFLQEQSS